jgi:hypothetical protein
MPPTLSTRLTSDFPNMSHLRENGQPFDSLNTMTTTLPRFVIVVSDVIHWVSPQSVVKHIVRYHPGSSFWRTY